jgi:uncharacterized membrane protein
MRRSERGEGRIGCIFGLLFFAAALFIAWKMIPIKVRSAELKQTIVDEAKSAGMRDVARIRRAIMSKAEDLELPLEDKNLTIKKTSSEIKVEARYTVPVDLAGYVYQWKFEHTAQNPIF